MQLVSRSQQSRTHNATAIDVHDRSSLIGCRLKPQQAGGAGGESGM
jgi:hypothetical protein